MLYLTAVIVLGVAAQWLAWRLRLPAILLLLAFGLAAGVFTDLETALDGDLLFPAVSLAVAVILFEGGLSLRFRELHDSSGVVLRLISIGALVTWVLSAVAAKLIFSSTKLAVLAGAVLVVTGPTVVGPLLRHIRPVRKLGSIAKWEGIVIDPVGALLAVLVYEAVFAQEATSALAVVLIGLLKTIVVATLIGLLTAFQLLFLFKRHWIPDYLESPSLLAAVVAAFTLSNQIQPESGLATVTILGVAIANQNRVAVRHLVEFKEILGVLLISVLFIVLSARLNPRDWLAIGWAGPAFLLLLVLVIRPVATFVATIGTNLNWRERTFLAWLAPRGIVAAAVASVFALELSERKQLPASIRGELDQLVPLTFLVIVGTVAIYGLTAGPLSRWLRLSDSNPQGILFAGAAPFVRQIASALNEQGYQTLLIDMNRQRIRDSTMQGLDALHADVLSESVQEELDLGGIGRLIAMTANDEVNSLAALHYVETFGRANVYQLASPTAKSAGTTSAAKPSTNQGSEAESSSHLRGRTAFGSDFNFENLHTRFLRGATIKRTRLTEEFTSKDFREMYGAAAVILFTVHPDGQLKVCTDQSANSLKPGVTIIALVDPPKNSST